MNLDRESLRKAALSRRGDGSTVPSAVTWPCEFCQKDFVTETGFMRHYCAAREKLETLRSVKGQTAYSYYAEWMRAKKHSVPDQTRFLSSRQWNHFLKFVEWSEKTAIPNPVQFIRIMVESNVEPMLWCRDTTYALYLQWYDNAYPPRDQFMETYDTLERRAEELGVPLNKIYQALGSDVVAGLVRRRKLSPWLLALSPNFLNWVQQLPENERLTVGDSVNFGAFAAKINSNSELAKEFRIACESADV